MLCGQCGGEIEADSRFCSRCGGAVGALPPAPPAAPSHRPGPMPPRAAGLPVRVTPAGTVARRVAPVGGSSCAWPLLLGLGFLALALAGLLAVGLLVGKPAWLPVGLASPSPSPAEPAEASPSPEPEPSDVQAKTPASREEPGEATPGTASSEDPDPRADLEEYYRLIHEDRFREAYDLRSARSRARTSYADFENTWSNNRSLAMDRFEVTARKPGRLQARIGLQADDVDVATGTSAVASYEGKVTLVLEEGRWRYDGGDFAPVQGPAGVVRSFYDWYLSRQDRAAYRRQLSEVKDLFTPVLHANLVSAFARGPGDGRWVDVDPFSDSQMGAAGYSARESGVDGDVATVDVAIEGSRGGTRDLRVHLARDGGRWRIADFSYGHRKGRLLDWLREINGDS